MERPDLTTRIKQRFSNLSVLQWVGFAALAALILLSPLLTRIAPNVFTEFRFRGLTTAAVYVIAALSLNLLVGYAGQISLGHAAFLGVGAFTTGYLTWWWGFPFLFALVVSGVLGGLFALLIGIPALRIRGLYLAVVTLAFGVFMESSIFNLKGLTGGQSGTTVYRPLQKGPLPESFEFIKNADFFVLCMVILIAVWVLDRAVVSSKVGRSFFGIREDEDVAASFGVDVAKFKLVAFTISGIIAGLAGSLYGSLIFIAQVEEFSFHRPPQFSLTFLIIIVLGGLGSRVGAATAAAFFAVFARLLTGLELWIPLIGSILLIYTMARHPGGLAQAFRASREAKGAKAARESEADSDLDDILPSLPAVSGSSIQSEPSKSGLVLEARSISVSFGGVQALNDVTLAVPQGKIVGLIGPNGAGKTTMFNVVSGLQTPTAGRVLLKDEDVTSLPPHARAARGLGRTFQLIGLAKALTVRENFLLAQHSLARYGIMRGILRLPPVGAIEAELEERSREAIASLGFERFTDTPVSNLSHGQQRLVELGCSLVTSPDLLLLDEPSGGMAPAAAESLAERLIDVRDKLGRTVLLIEHHIPLVLAVCDEIYVLNFGVSLAHGTTEHIRNSPEVIAAYFGEAA